MTEVQDWYPSTQDGEFVMFSNVNAKIDNYVVKYGLVPATVDRVKLMCNTFTLLYQKVKQNQATMKDLNSWFTKTIMKGKPEGSPAPNAPSFQFVTLPAGAFIGIEKEFRKFVAQFKENSAYIEADGIDLMIVKTDGDDLDLSTITPELKVSVNVNNEIEVTYTKGVADGLELQYRKDGSTMWQLADKSTEKVITFTPQQAVAGVPEKFELRGVYLIKNHRTGQWSPIYTVTFG